ncbi:hypothetical protein LI610_06230 [Lactobacillus delbrueckii subsp. indicus]|uniref:restriction endonuclease subunit S n=1 Tax=Lactobacillus delbrueckii TaxID=1584 RepID=UPI0009384E52|nr:restriction endonuclease subunit S [Lactobacillus delbrueckii]APP02150.1 hypothetical protein LI610_00120 [Lactobacillus delbrueckii subsp. indicus]APP03139.1 hypothetical protein LI610_06230 [Lactobacillus delbrueckii subsp. indicus]
MGDVADRVTTKNKGMVSELPLTISAQDGLISQDEFFNKKVASKDLSSYLLLHHGDFAYNKSYSNGYPFGTIKRLEKYPQGVVSSLYIAFKPNSRISSDFMAQYYESNNWHKEIYKCATEGARNHGLLNVPPSDFFTTDLNIPIKKSEQLKIGRLLNAVDQTITLHEEKERQLERLKSALLQKMFADKSGYPAVRFKGFNEAWTNRKLGNYFDYEQPTPYIVTNTNYSDEYNTPVLTAGQSFILGYTNEDIGLKCATYKEPVIIFDDFTTSTHLVTFPFKVKSSAMKILTLTQKNDSMYFGYTSLQNIKYKPLNHERQWISIFSKIKIGIPISKIEERKIGNLFERIDHLDNYYQQKIERLNSIKQSLLQKMFI